MFKSRLFIHILLFPCLITTSCITWAAAGAQRPGWRLVWSDEFNRSGPPDPKKWKYEEGFIRNQEAQYYTRGHKENARVEKGVLVLEARKERVRNARYRPGARDWKENRPYAEYTAASLNTRGIASWKYGRFEMRARMPQGAGTWPAFWTMGVKRGWPANGEIDIMEWWGKEPNEMTANVHYQAAGKHRSKQGRIKASRLHESFHVYTMDWTPERIVFYLDGKKYHSFAVKEAQNGNWNPFRQPHYLLLNFALGGTSAGRIDDSALPQKFIIDYVRVYQKR